MEDWMTPTKTTVGMIMQDDYFELGGEIYRVLALANNKYGGTVISAYGLDMDPSRIITLVMPKSFPIAIFHQK